MGQKKKKENEAPAEVDCGRHNFSEKERDVLRTDLLRWYDGNARSLPWRTIARTETDLDKRGYSVLVSEIMLQQTQVATVIDYFNRWIEKWPSTMELSGASLEEINQAWSGLGYYSRGRRLWEGARHVESELSGRMPRTREDLLKLSGVGKYTASAVASIAYGQKVGVVDGNVLRVLSRLRGIAAEIDNSKVVEHMWTLADTIIDPDRPGDFNQSMMELGATVCTPKAPSCSDCPLKSICLARKLNATTIVDIEDGCFRCSKSNINCADGVLNYPRKAKKQASREETTLVLALSKTGPEGQIHYAIQQRPASGLLANLWELLTVPLPSPPTANNNQQQVDEKQAVENYLEERKIVHNKLQKKGVVNHVFSHINMSYVVYTAVVAPSAVTTGEDSSSSSQQQLHSMQFATLDEFNEKGTSTAMKKVVKLLQSVAASDGGKKRKLETKSVDPKQRSINCFFKSVKKEN